MTWEDTVSRLVHFKRRTFNGLSVDNSWASTGGGTAVAVRMPSPRPSTLQRKKEKYIAIFLFFIPRAIKASVSLQTQLKGKMQNVPWYITKVHAPI